MHTVGDIADMRFFCETPLIEIGEHLLRHAAVNAAHPVDFLGETAREDAHRELVEGVSIVSAAEAHERLPTYIELLGVSGEIGAHQIFREGIVTGGHGRVGGVKRRGLHQLDRHLTVHMLVLHHLQDAFQIQEGGMAFVEMEDGRGFADGLEHTHATDTEQNLLFETIFDIAAVQGGRHAAILLPVLIEVGIKEIERYATDIHAPDAGVEVTAGHRHADHEPVAILVLVGLDGQFGEALRRVKVDLLAVCGNLLLEIAIAIEQSHTEHVHVAVAGLLEVVAGQHAKTAGENLQLVADTELHAEVGDTVLLAVARLLHIGRKPFIYILQLANVFFVMGEVLHSFQRQQLQHVNGVFFACLPKGGTGNFLKQLAGLERPAPPQILRKFLQKTQLLRQTGFHRDAMPVRFLHLKFLHHHAHIGSLVLVLRVTLAALTQRNVVRLLIIGEKMRPQGFFSDIDRRLADVGHGLRGTMVVEQNLVRDGLHHLIVVMVGALNHTDALLLGEVLLHPRAETGQRGRDGRDTERDALQRCITPWFIIRWEHGEVKANQQVIVFHIEDAIFAVQIDRGKDHLHIFFRTVM